MSEEVFCFAAGFKSPAPWATPSRNAFANPMTMASPRPLGDNGNPFQGMGMGMGAFRGGMGGRGQPGYSGVQRTRREDNLIGKSLFVAKGPYRYGQR